MNQSNVNQGQIKPKWRTIVFELGPGATVAFTREGEGDVRYAEVRSGPHEVSLTHDALRRLAELLRQELGS